MDTVIRNAQLRARSGLVDIGIQDGRICTVENHLGQAGGTAIDAGGKLVCPPFVDPHVHLDAVLLDGRTVHNQSGTLLEGIANWGIEKQSLTKAEIRANALKVISWYVANGVLKIRTHVDSTLSSLINVETLVEIRRELADTVDIQIVAFPQDGLFTHPGFDVLMERALDMGCDVVGGIPHNEMTREDGVLDVLRVFDLAEKRGLLIDIHCDETGDAQSRFVETIAAQTIKRGMEGRVTASHTTAMHNYDNDYAFKLIGLIKRAGLHMVTNPFDNSVLQNRNDGYPRRRGHTRVDELLARGVNVSIGHDSVMDPWYPMGFASMLAAANLFLHYGQFSGHDQVADLFDMITINGARTMAQEADYGIEVGKQADLLILNARDEHEAIRLMAPPLWVLRRGKVVAQSQPGSHQVKLSGETVQVDFKK